ncbi:MAG TPA: glutathione S-transferase family protein [Pseudomonadales bacterium]|jgi:glutathione S-transferase
MIRIYHVAGTRSVRVIWLCEELGLPYEKVAVDFSPAYRATPEWRRLNPVGKVPVLVDDDVTMFESGAMVEHLLDRHGAGRLRPPPGTAERAAYLQWSWFAEATFARPLGEIVNHRREFPGESEIPAVLEEMSARAALCVQALDEALAGRQYLLGDEFTAADVMMGYSVLLARALGIEGARAGRVGAYFDVLARRSGYPAATADLPDAWR